MSHQDPGTETPHDQDFAVPAARKPGASRRYVAAFAAAALAAIGVGTAVWAWQSFMGQGAQPAEALPANTLAYAALDLDPPGGQKVEAFKTLQRFPSIKHELGLGSVDDVQKSVVNQISSDSGCKLDYQAVKPWLGDRIAGAVVSQKGPEAVLVLQVTDQAKARAELGKDSVDCHFGYAFSGDWAILARNDAVATEVSHDTKSGSLSDHADFKRLTGAAGGAGLVSLYAAPEAGEALLKVIDDDPYSGTIALQMVSSALDPMSSFVTTFGLLAVAQPTFSDSVVGVASSAEEPRMTPAQKQKQAQIDAKFEHYDELTKAQQKQLMTEQDKLFEEIYGPIDDEPSFSDDSGTDDGFPTPKLDPALRSSLESFTGLGGVGRFADHGLEVEVVGDALKGTSADMYAGSKGGDLTSKLPQDTAVAFGAGLASGWVDTLFKQLNTGYMFGGSTTDAEVKKSFEKATGLDVPGDVEALGGDGATLVGDAGIDWDSLFDDPTKAPVAARITGDQAKIESALAKLNHHRGKTATPILSKRVGDDVVVSANETYLNKLVRSDGLGDSEDYQQVLPDADGATTVLYLNFDAGDWLTKSAGSDSADAKPLHALGMSVKKGDGQQHVLVRLSFDD